MKTPESQRETTGVSDASAPPSPTVASTSEGDRPIPRPNAIGQRGDAIAQLTATIAALASAGDLAGAQALYAALGALLAIPPSLPAPVVDLVERAARRTARR